EDGLERRCTHLTPPGLPRRAAVTAVKLPVAQDGSEPVRRRVRTRRFPCRPALAITCTESNQERWLGCLAADLPNLLAPEEAAAVRPVAAPPYQRLPIRRRASRCRPPLATKEESLHRHREARAQLTPP